MTRSLLFLLLCPALVALNACEKDENKEDEEYAYPTNEMLRFFDFPAGSWWQYKCLTDGTTDTLKVLESAKYSLKMERSGGGSYSGRRCRYKYSNENSQFQIGEFTKSTNPLGSVIDGKESEHEDFYLLIASHGALFNSQYCLYHPIEKIMDSNATSAPSFTRFDTTIQSMQLSDVYSIKNSWVNSTFSNPIVEEWYVQDIGVVRYTLQNGMEYELVDYHINQ